MPDLPEPPATAPAATYRWRRRAVTPVRVTWLGMVLVLCLLIHKTLVEAMPGIGQGGKVLAFILVVVLPMLALALWRAGLLPPERYLVDGPEGGSEPR